MDYEKIAMAAIPVVLGVIVAGLIMNALGTSVPLLSSASQGYHG